MTKEEYLDFCGSIAGATYDQPFNEDFQSTALRHWDTKKWFGLLMLHNDRWIVNLKLKPEEVLFYRDIFAAAGRIHVGAEFVFRMPQSGDLRACN